MHVVFPKTSGIPRSPGNSQRKKMTSRKKRDMRKIRGYPKIGKNMMFEKNRTSEHIGGTDEARKFAKNHAIQKNGTFEKLGGNQKFWKIMLSGRMGHPKFSAAQSSSRPDIHIHINPEIRSHITATFVVIWMPTFVVDIRSHINSHIRGHITGAFVVI